MAIACCHTFKRNEEESFLALLRSPLLQLVCSVTMYAETKVSARKQEMAKDRVVFAYSDSCREAQRCRVQYKLGQCPMVEESCFQEAIIW